MATPERLGCVNYSGVQHFGRSRASAMSTLIVALEDLEERVMADPRVIDAMSDYEEIHAEVRDEYWGEIGEEGIYEIEQGSLSG